MNHVKALLINNQILCENLKTVKCQNLFSELKFMKWTLGILFYLKGKIELKFFKGHSVIDKRKVQMQSFVWRVFVVLKAIPQMKI